MGFSLKRTLRKVAKPFKKVWKGAEDLAHKVGVDKDHLSSVAPVVSMINPIAGAVVGAAGGGMEGAIKALSGTLIGNLISNKPLLDLSASGRIQGLQEAINKISQKPENFIKNIIYTGGDYKKAALLTLLQTNPNLKNYQNEIWSALTQGTGLDKINFSDFGLGDVVGLYSLIKYLKSKPPEPPAVPEMDLFDENKINELYNAYEQLQQDKLAEATKQLQTDYSRRGLYRSGLLASEEDKMRENLAKNLANYKAKLNTEAMQYNNQLKQQAYLDALQRHGLISDYEKARMEAIANLASNWLAGKNFNLFGNGGNSEQSQYANIMGSILNDVLNNKTGNGGNVITDNIPTEIPDVNLTDIINQNQNEWINQNTYNQMSPNHALQAPARPQTTTSTTPQITGGFHTGGHMILPESVLEHNTNVQKMLAQYEEKYKQNLRKIYADKIAQWKPGMRIPLDIYKISKNAPRNVAYVDADGSIKIIHNINQYVFKKLFGGDLSEFYVQNMMDKSRRRRLEENRNNNPPVMRSQTIPQQQEEWARNNENIARKIYADKIAQWKPGTRMPLGTLYQDLNGAGAFAYIDTDGSIKTLGIPGFMSNMRFPSSSNNFREKFKNLFGIDYTTFTRQEMLDRLNKRLQNVDVSQQNNKHTTLADIFMRNSQVNSGINRQLPPISSQNITQSNNAILPNKQQLYEQISTKMINAKNNPKVLADMEAEKQKIKQTAMNKLNNDYFRNVLNMMNQAYASGDIDFYNRLKDDLYYNISSAVGGSFARNRRSAYSITNALDEAVKNNMSFNDAIKHIADKYWLPALMINPDKLLNRKINKTTTTTGFEPGKTYKLGGLPGGPKITIPTTAKQPETYTVYKYGGDALTDMLKTYGNDAYKYYKEHYDRLKKLKEKTGGLANYMGVSWY